MKPPLWVSRLCATATTSASSVPSPDQPTLQQLLAIGLLEIVRHGSQRSYHVSNPQAFQLWVDRKYPPHTEPAATQGVRAQNIARTRNSKAGTRTHAQHAVLWRWFDHDSTHPLATWTANYGVASCTNTMLHTLPLSAEWDLLTVENWESFMGLVYDSPPRPIMAIYTGGQIADAVIGSIAALSSPQRALHFGDYDWTGVSIFRRLATAIPHMTLYIPPDIAELFTRYGNHALIANQPPLAQLPTDEPNVQHIIRLISHYNCGLEQEIVPPPPMA
jgi:hypothetical protein